MHIPYESLVLITASGGAIIVFFIAVAIFCICRHTRRSPKSVIHILTNVAEGADDTEQPVDQVSWERNQLIPTARFLHALNPKAKIRAISSSKSTLCPLVHPCIIEHPSPVNTSSLINHNLPIDTVVTKPISLTKKIICSSELHYSPPPSSQYHHTLEKLFEGTSDSCSSPASSSQFHHRTSEKLFTGASGSCSYQKDDRKPSLSTVTITQHAAKLNDNNKSSKGEIVEDKSIFLSSTYNICSQQQNRVQITRRRHSFQEASTSNETAKSRRPEQLSTKKIGRSSSQLHVQSSSSIQKCSTQRGNLERRHSYRSPSDMKAVTTVENRRLLRAHSFAARTKINVESRSGRSSQNVLQTQKSRTRNKTSVTPSSRQIQPHSRTPSVLGIMQANHSRVQVFPILPSNQQPSTSACPSTVSSHVEDVIVLDGSEPPPPYFT